MQILLKSREHSVLQQKKFETSLLILSPSRHVRGYQPGSPYIIHNFSLRLFNSICVKGHLLPNYSNDLMVKEEKIHQNNPARYHTA